MGSAEGSLTGEREEVVYCVAVREFVEGNGSRPQPLQW